MERILFPERSSSPLLTQLLVTDYIKYSLTWNTPGLRPLEEEV